MYKALVVDNEEWIRTRLVNTIDNGGVDAQVIDEACDGKEAFEKAVKLKPDIIITDIRMPVISGLEFIRELKKAGIISEIIIISGYSDFEYAQESVKFGVREYLLKPVEDLKLLTAVKDCIKNIEEKKREQTVIKDLEEKLVESKPLLKERFYFNLLNGYVNDSEFNSGIGYFNIINTGLNHICYLVQIDKEVNDSKRVYLIPTGIKDIVKEFSGIIGTSEVISLQSGGTACLISSKLGVAELEMQVETIAAKVKKVVSGLFQKTLTIGIGRGCDDLRKISDSFSQAQQALSKKAYLGGDSIYTNINRLSKKSVLNHNYSIEKIKNAVCNADYPYAVKMLNNLTSEMASEELLPIDLKSMFVNIIFTITKSGIGFNNIYEDLDGFEYNFFSQVNMINNKEDFSVYLKEEMHILVDYIKEIRKNNKRKKVRKAIDFINSNFNEQISLTDVAETVFLNPSYFCKIFKNEIGISFTKYLMNYRIEKAIELMADPVLKIYEIAEKVGYSDVQYFTKIFKNVKGVVPSQYRNRIK